MAATAQRRRSTSSAILVLVGVLIGCSHDDDGVTLRAPFNDATKLARVTAVWSATKETRTFAEASKLKEPEVRFQYRVDIDNDLQDRLYVKLDGFELVDEKGLALGRDAATTVCTLNPGRTESILSGGVWLPQRTADAVRNFRVGHFAVPLSARGLGMYREWLLQSRPDQTAAIDAELAVYAAAPPCPHAGN